MTDENKPERKKRDWLGIAVDVGAIAIIVCAVTMVAGIAIFMLRTMRIIP